MRRTLCGPMVLVVILCAIFSLVSCGRKADPPSPGKLAVATAIPPLADIVRHVAGEHATVLTVVPAGQSPHTYEPTPREQADISNANVYLAIRLPFENRLVEKLQGLNPKMKLFDISYGIHFREMTAEEEHSHEHENADEHEHEHEHAHDHEHEHGAHPEHGEMDPHIWLSPENGILLAENIAKTLAAEDPANADEYKKNAQAYVAQLRALSDRIAESLASFEGREFLVYHPAFGYFGDAYGLRQLPVEIDGKEPGARQLAELIEEAHEHDIRIIFVQPQFSDKSARAVAQEIGGAVVPLDPLSADYLDMLEAIAGALEQSFSSEK